MSKAPRHRRPLIEALEPRLLFSATADIAVFDDGHSDGQYLAYAAQDVDLVSIYKPDDALDIQPLIMQDATPDIPQIDAVIFVDTAVDNYQLLVNDIEKALNDQSIAIVYLDSTKDGLTQISDYLAGVSGISAVHIISHGVAGSVQLGTQVLNENNIAQYQQALGNWKNSLDDDADILLYGCDVAANQSGVNLLRQLSDLTGADVAASNDLTGNAANADWELEERVGQIETTSIFSSTQNMEWQGVLADVVHLYSGVATNEQAIPTGGYVMQGVQLTSSHTVDRIQVMLANHGTSSATVQVFVHEHSYNGTVVASASVNTASLGSSLGTVNFDFAQTTFNAYTVYWIEFRTNNGADNLVGIGYINSNVIASEFVVNGSGDGNKDMSIALVDVQNHAPTVANAIPNQTATEEALFSYTFAANTFSDQDGDTLTYTATLSNGNPLPPWLSFNAATRTFSGVPDDGDVGTISVKVTANDGNGGTIDDTFDLVVNNVNDNPFLNIPVPNQNATEDAAFNYTFPANTFGDGDLGASFTYTATLAGGGALPAWLNFDSATRTFSGTPANGDVGTISVKLTADDGAGGTANDTFDIVVANTNDAPTVANAIPNQTATENALFNYTFAINTFNDQDVGNTLTYTAQLAGGGALPAWLSFDGATRTFNGTPSNGDVGNITIQVIANDGTTTVSDFFDLDVQNVGSSNVVYETSGPSTDTQIIAAGVPFFQSFFHDSVGATYTIDSIVLQLVKDPSAAAQTITVTLLSGAFNGTVVDSATVSSADISTTLAWKAFDFTNTVLTDNQLYFIKIESTSNDGQVKAAIHNSNVYNNGSFHSSTGVADTGRDVAFQISSGANIDPVIVNPIPNQNATEDAAFNFQFAANTFNDADVGDTLTYTATMADGSALPAWLSFNAATRTFSGTPTNGDVGTISVKVTADDGNGGTPATDTFDLVVANSNDAPTIANAIPNQNATEDSVFNFTFAANTFADQDVGNTLSYSAQLAGGGALPAWLSFDSATRTFSGTPTNAFVGTVSIDVIASDGNGGTVTDTFNIVVANTNDAPTVANAITNQNATEDAAFNFQFAANTFSDQDLGDTLTYSAQLAGGGALPSWLSFNAATRTFSGTPANGDVGSFSVDVTASDGNGGSVTDTFSVTVANVNDAPSVSIALTDYYTSEQTAVNLHGTGISISDVDTNSVTVTIAGPAPHSELTANVGTTGVSIFSGNGTPSLVITGTLTQVNDFLAGNNGGTLTYRLAGDTPMSTATLTITANDGALTGNDTATINISAVNDAPVNSVPGAQVTTEDTALVFSTGNSNQIQIADPDAAAGAVQVTLSVTNGTLTLAGTTGLSFTTGDGTADSTLVFTGTLADINTALATLTYNPTANYNGAAVLSLTTSDQGNTGSGGTLTDTDTVNITVNAGNDAPTVANAIPNQNATEDAAFNFQFAANAFADVDAGATLTYSAQLNGGGALPAWLSFNAATRTFSGTPANGDVGTISIDVIADDGNGGTVTDTFNIVVGNANDAPTVANAIPNQNATEDAAFNFQFAANTFADPDVGDTLTYSAQLAGGGALPAWLSFDPVTRTFSGTPLNANVGTVSIDVIANDGNGGTVTDTFDIVVANTNDAPTVANAIPNQNATEDAAFNFQFAANTFADVDVGATLTYSAQLNGGGALPAWLSFNAATRTFSGTPANGDVGTISIDVIADDGNGGTVTDTFNIVVGNANDAPTVANAIPNQNATEDAAFNFQFAANTFADPDVGDTLTYSAQLAGGGALPAWLSFDPVTRTFSGTPLNANVGTVSIDVIANDGNGGTVTDTFDIVVANTNDAPTVANAIPDRTATENAAFNFQFAANTFADVDAGATLTYSVQLNGGGALPAWLSFNAATRTFSGTPTNADLGSVSIDVIADDGNGGTVTDTFTITVNDVNDAPTVANAIPDQNATEDAAFNFQFAANTFADIDVGNVLTYSAQVAGGGALPVWLSFDPATRTFSGTPVNADVGTLSIDVIADDGNGGTVTDTFDIVIANTNDAPTVANPIADQTATESNAFNFQFPANTFADVDAGATLTYSAQLAGGGALPAWLSFDAITRTFSGTPGTPNVGAVAIDVIASDGNGGSVTDTFSVTVNALPANLPPTVQAGISDQSVNEDSNFSFTIPANAFADAEGDSLSYSAQLAGGGALPSWLSFDASTGTFFGTPGNGDVGVVNLQVSVNDGNGGSISDTFTITVVNTNDAPTLIAPSVNPVAHEDQPFNLSFPLTMFNDIDVGDSLSYSAQLANGQALPTWLHFDADTLTFTGTPGNSDVGNLSIQLIASDGEASVNFQFALQVEAVNDAPVAGAPITINNIEDAPGDQLDLFSIFSDEETPASQLQYTVVSNSNAALVSSATVDANTGKLMFSYGANQFGVSDLIIRAQDTSGATVETAVRINIASVNDVPVSAGINDINVNAGAQPQQIDLRKIFSDIENGTALQYSLIANTNTAVVPSVQWNQTTGMMTISFAASSGGETFITLRAQDNEGAWVDTRFKVNVTAPVVVPDPEIPSKPPVTPPTVPPVTEVPTTPPVTPPTTPPTDGNGENPGSGNNGEDVGLPETGIDTNLPGTSGQGVPPVSDSNDARDNVALPNDKSSRDYARFEADLESQNIPVTTLTASSSLVSLIATDDGFAPWEAADFDNEVRRIRDQMDVAMEEEQDRRAVVAGLTFSVTTGLLVWSLRASSLLLTLMSMLPLWRGLDPLPILDEVNKRKKELEQQRKDRAREDKSSKEVGYLFDHAQQKNPGQ
ncbi:tandem-95 repeat protein [Cellvibrio sp. KY-GH-1]|uniref:putative Ig domain-containing protein n=1 Tax=Cellvibrio sp. KY-GH-1 TaxID=2303332 RepID=UPI001247507D|nr:putative Ig domain-containing protein [Cellvibrio sp. KY-GH-1]QEY14522.1 tandem-95 repeat protein [Cellvibrio sp. KY-GH-1]